MDPTALYRAAWGAWANENLEPDQAARLKQKLDKQEPDLHRRTDATSMLLVMCAPPLRKERDNERLEQWDDRELDEHHRWNESRRRVGDEQ